ncbi:MAG TPA: C4-dicarboxylate ABC transporter, partial [Bradyrhizobium sp.]|nr:C4-dicarboxylate ABC transporter [Bradyrhizobium sp.]
MAELHPGAFALVMATGIISNAVFLEGYRAWADLLFAVILFAYPCLILFTLLRLALFSRAVWRDLSDPRLVFSFFTLVAGTGVFGVALHLRGFATAAVAMWLFALALWFV